MKTSSKIISAFAGVGIVAGTYVVNLDTQEVSKAQPLQTDLTCTEIAEQASNNIVTGIAADESGDTVTVSAMQAKNAQLAELANAQNCKAEYIALSPPPPVKSKTVKAGKSKWELCGKDLDCRQKLIRQCRKETGQTRDTCKEALKNA